MKQLEKQVNNAKKMTIQKRYSYSIILITHQLITSKKLLQIQK